MNNYGKQKMEGGFAMARHPLINDNRKFLIYSSDPWPEFDPLHGDKWRGAELTVMDTGDRYIFLDGWQPHPEQVYNLLHGI